jgi:DNA primase catalytic core
MTLHKLTAGNGYTYLTRQVAAQDTAARGSGSLGNYYSEKGEAPGVWMGRGLAGVSEFPIGAQVTEAQMVALFGKGRHPNAEQIEGAARAAGATPQQADHASRLGNPYRVFEQRNEFRRRCADELRDHNVSLGLDAATAVPPGIRARVRSTVATAMFVETYCRPPIDARELSGHLARISRQPTTAVAGYDLTFSPVKSVSTLWAIAASDVAAVIERAHHDAVTDTLTWLEDHAAYTRVGRNGVAQVNVRGLIGAGFTHRDSRAGDPDLHTHVAISNKVHTLDGRWLALDGRPFYRNNVAASERYNTRLEAFLVDRLGIRFADRPDTELGKRPVREIVGVDGPLPRFWSSRRTAINVRRGLLSAQFQRDHGRPPTTVEAVALAQQANLETRQGKHEPRSYAQQRSAWRTEALAVLGGERPLHDYVRTALRRRPATPSATRPSDAWVSETAARLVTVVAGVRATWQESHVRAEAERQVRAAGIELADLDGAVEALVRTALSPPLSMRLGSQHETIAPAALRRTDGASVYTVAGSALYTSSHVLSAEQAVLAAAARRDGRVTPASAVNVALLDSTANGVTLNPDQEHLVRELATSGARVQLALAPAGTGKTTAMRVLAAAWVAGGGDVVGLAPSAAASAVLREHVGADTDTLAKLIHALSTGIDVPTWLRGIGPKTLVIVDEAGMAGTADLAKVVDFVTGAGGSVRLIGDDRQLAAIGAGGLLRDLAARDGVTTLTQVVRFTHPDTGLPNHAEGAASLALRDGDPIALAYYVDHGRVHVGDIATIIDEAYAAWASDRAAGRDAVLLAPTRKLAGQLNARARRDRLSRQTEPRGPEVTLADTSLASAGDVVITRRNQRTIPICATDWVKNGDRWTIAAVHGSGALDVVHDRTSRHVTLPADYVHAHVTLGYATTVHGAQGVTAGQSYVIATGMESRQQLYVALTRGRHENHVFLAVAADGDPHSVITRDALLPPTAVELLTRVLQNDDTSTSALSRARALADPAVRLHKSSDCYHHALTTAAEQQLGVHALGAIDTACEDAMSGLTLQDAYPVLRGHLAVCAIAGQDPVELLQQALSFPRGLQDARDAAAVLDWRIDPTSKRSTGTGPLQWLPPVPEPLASNSEWGPYLAERGSEVTALAAEVADQSRAWTPASAPIWARPFVDRDAVFVADLAVWRAAHGVEDGDRRPTGPPLRGAADARCQRMLDARAAHLLGEPGSVTARWRPLADTTNRHIAADSYWPLLAERLDVAERAGIDVAALVRAAAGRALPDEMPAAALWWRLTPHLSPATATAARSLDRSPHPDWARGLIDVFGAAAADRITADPAWPALVATVGRGRNSGWQPLDLLATAQDLLRAAQPEDEPLRSDELATAITWRVSQLLDADRLRRDDAIGLGWLVGLTEPDDAACEPEPEPLDSDAKDPPAAFNRQRLLELNEQAAAFFTDRYPDAWTATYLAGRLGIDPTKDADLGRRFTIGYAPGGWTSLTDHLRHLGATDAEIVATGLGSYASTGRVIDRFRDRLVFAIRDGDEIHGWIGRRSPARDDDRDHVVPKYLNTAQTDLFSKGDELYGLTEGEPALAAGATPVLVEGPLDALAITIAGDGAYVGLAPLGTALTDAQVDLLRPFMGPERRGVIVATDADHAGHQAADRIFWRLTARGDDPRYLVLAPGEDPAECLQTVGPAALRGALDTSVSLATALIEARVETYADRLDTVEGQVLATRRAASVIAALPPTSWATHIVAVVALTGIAPDIAATEVMDAAGWRGDADDLLSTGSANRRLAPSIDATEAWTNTGVAASVTATESCALADSVQAARTSADTARQTTRSGRKLRL